jgi:hypothetical protein
LVIADGQPASTVFGAISGLCGPIGEYQLVAAPTTSLNGIVLDPDGSPVAGAEVSAWVDVDRFLLAFPNRLDADTLIVPRTTSAPRGEFQLEVPAVDGLALLVKRRGYALARHELSLSSSLARAPIVLTLRRAAAPWLEFSELHGQVLLADGSPAWDARVVLGNTEARADIEGRFALDLGRGIRHDDLLCAALPGQMTALVADPSLVLSELGTPDAPVILKLGGPALSISGRLVDHLGNPCSGWKIEIEGGTFISPSIRPTLLAEHLASGRVTGQPAATDGKGAFRIGGLSARAYVLYAQPPWPSAYDEDIVLRSQPIQAGAERVEVRLGAPPRSHHIRARCIDLEGAPWAGVEVALEHERPTLWRISEGFHPLERAVADLEGRFELRRVPNSGAEFCVESLGIPLWAVDRAGEEWELTVPRRPNLRFDWKRAVDPPLELEALDPSGHWSPVFTFLAGRPRAIHRALDLDGVRSYLLAVGPWVTTLRLRLAAGAGEDVPCRIEPGSVTRIVLD